MENINEKVTSNFLNGLKKINNIPNDNSIEYISLKDLFYCIKSLPCMKNIGNFTFYSALRETDLSFEANERYISIYSVVCAGNDINKLELRYNKKLERIDIITNDFSMLYKFNQYRLENNAIKPLTDDELELLTIITENSQEIFEKAQICIEDCPVFMKSNLYLLRRSQITKENLKDNKNIKIVL